MPGLEREAAALELLTAHGVGVPRLLDRIVDPEFWPYPITVVSRVRARPWSELQQRADRDQMARMLAGLGRLIGSYHAIDVAELPAPIAIPPAPSPEPYEARIPHFSDYREPRRLAGIAAALAAALDLPGGRADHWLEVVRPCLDLNPVLVHRDLNEGQVMIDSDGEVAGLIDWENAGLEHPLSDLNFGEWGPGIFAWEADFTQLRRVFWDAYVGARGVALPNWRAVQLLMTMINAPAPEGNATAWFSERRDRTLANLRAIDAEV